MTTFPLGRKHAMDDRDQNFPLSAVLEEPVTLPSYRYYFTGPVHDQGDRPSCVGHAWSQWLMSDLIRTRSGPQAYTIYREAQKIDEWPGEAYDGTSVRAGAKYLQSLGHIASYHWAQSVEDIVRWLLSGAGTVVLGTYWHEGMFYPDKKGFIHPTGPAVGGHAYLLVGWSRKRNAGRIVNSWGRDWGQGGRAWLAGDDLAGLFHTRGEACVAVEKRLTNG